MDVTVSSQLRQLTLRQHRQLTRHRLASLRFQLGGAGRPADGADMQAHHRAIRGGAGHVTLFQIAAKPRGNPAAAGSPAVSAKPLILWAFSETRAWSWPAFSSADGRQNGLAQRRGGIFQDAVGMGGGFGAAQGLRKLRRLARGQHLGIGVGRNPLCLVAHSCTPMSL
jgi:hypothetical protein